MARKTLTRLFVCYVVTVIVAWVALWVLFSTGVLKVAPADRAALPLLLMPASALGLFWLYALVGLGTWVYRDARRHGMEPLLWALVAVLVPYFAGVVVYLLLRQGENSPCPACGVRQQAGAAFCASCGHPLRELCASCKAPLAEGASFCPACGAAVAKAG